MPKTHKILSSVSYTSKTTAPRVALPVAADVARRLKRVRSPRLRNAIINEAIRREWLGASTK